MIRCITPVDGSIYAERPTLDLNAARDVAVRAQAAQADWAALPLDERIARVRAGVAAIGAMNGEIVPELAW